jgi:hypothetical protein
MDKNIKRALKTGVDENDDRLHYYCPKCGWDIPLLSRRCPKCGAKRPADAYNRAVRLRDEILEAQTRQTPDVYIDRSCMKIPAPKAPCYAAPGVDKAEESCYATDAMEQLGIPKFYTSDEYGRVFETPVCYKPLPFAGPVPVPAPSRTVQTDAIKVPIDITAK